MRVTRVARCGAVLSALAVAAGCAGGPVPAATDGGRTSLKVAAAPTVISAPLLVGVDQGIFARHGLDVQAEVGGLGPTVFPRILAGQVDLGVNTWGTLITARTQNLPLTGIAPVDRGGSTLQDDYQAIVARPGGPTSVAALAGKVVGVPTLGSFTDSQVRDVLAAQGVDVRSVQFVALPFPDAPAALSAGRVAAAAVFEPFLTTAADVGAVPLAALSQGQALGTVVAARSWVERNPDALARFQAAWAEALVYSGEHPEAVRKVLVSGFSMDPAVAERIRLPRWQPAIERADVQQVVDMMVRTGSIPTVLDAATLITPYRPQPGS